MSDIPKFDSGSISPISGSTPYGFYDLDSTYQNEGPKLALWVARRLGYPVTDVELDDFQIYACFEEAITEYGAQVHQFNIRQNMMKAQGGSTGSSLNNTPLNDGSLNTLIDIAQDYGSEAGVGGDIDYQKGFIEVNANQQEYDLLNHPSSSINPSSAFYGASGSNSPTASIDGISNIEIKEIYHNEVPASERYYYPYYGTAGGTTSGAGGGALLDEFDFDGYPIDDSYYMLYPVYEDLLRIQGLELSDTVRRSQFTFKIINNKLTLFPIPRAKFKVWFDFIEKADRSGFVSRDGDGVVSDYSNIPYSNLKYSDINDVGKQWIRKYTLALCKELLGEIREKYSNIIAPGDQLTLNGPSLRSEAQTEKEMLMQQLRENLDEVGRRKQMEMENDISEKMQQQMSRVPTKIYIG